MTLRPTLPGFVAALAALATILCACGGERLLVGEGPDAGSPGAAGTGGSLSGTAGTGTAGAAGTGVAGAGIAGVSGAAATTGAAGSVSVQVHPLAISGAEAVTRIAKVLWDDVPDADLMLQASQGHFKYTSDLYGAVHQMLVDPRAAKGVGAFYRWWLDLDNVAAVKKDPMLFPDYTPALQADMVNEVETFGTKVTLDLNATYDQLMTTTIGFVNARLAALYGASGVTGDQLQQTSLSGVQRAGLLTRAAILVQGTNLTANDPSLRGTYLAQKVFCKQVPAPPPGENSFPTPPTGTSVRTALTQNISAQPVCQACHAILDPPGYAFESYDAIGRWRTMDNGAPVDTSALQVTGLFQDSIQVNSAYELIKDISVAPEARQCYARQWLAFALAKQPSDVRDADANAAFQAFSTASFNLKELIVAVLTSDVFLANMSVP